MGGGGDVTVSRQPIRLLFFLFAQTDSPCRKQNRDRTFSLSGFFEYLLDRRTENAKECQELKYEVIKKMCSSPFISNVFDKPSILKLRQFVRDGSFYVGSEVSVSMEQS